MKFRFPTVLLLLLLGLAGALQPLHAQGGAPAATVPAAAPSGLTKGETQQLISVLQDPQKRSQFVNTLQNLEKAGSATGQVVVPAATAPAAAAAPAATAAAAAPAAAPAAAAPAPAADTKKSAVTLEPNSLGADLLSHADTVLSQVASELGQSGASMFDYHGLARWLANLNQNATFSAIILDTTWRLAVVMLAGLLAEYIVRLGTRPLYRRLGRESGSAEARAEHRLAQDTARALSRKEAEGAGGTADEILEAHAEGDLAESEGAEGVAAESEGPEAPGGGTLAAASPEPLPEEEEPDAPPPPILAGQLGEGARPVRSRLMHSGWPLLRRLPFILLAMIVDAIPVFAFMLVGTILLATPLVADILVRLAVGAVVNAYALCRLLLVVARGGFCAPTPKLRLLHISNEAAAFLATWSRRIALVILIGFSIVQIGSVSGMTVGLQNSISRIFSLVIHLMLVTMVIKRRREVAAWLVGASGSHRTAWQVFKARLARVWHWQAVVLIMLLWTVFATEVTNHVQHPTRLILGTIALLILFRVLHIVILGAVEKAFSIGSASINGHYAMIAARAARYHRPLRYCVNVLVVAGLLLSLMWLWDVRALSWLAVGDLGRRLVSSLGTIGVTLLLAIIIWETLNFCLQIYLDDLSRQGLVIRAARLRTVLPLLRNTLLVLLLAVFVLTVLSEVGVNIGPLLAGASIFGVALGFGSQKLVQDFINGIFLLLENAMQVGDTVTAAGLSGTVENLSIRTLRLRASDGSVHIIPFSSVTTVTNTNKGRGNATLSISVDYAEDTDQVADLLKTIVAEMRQEDAYKDGMLSDFAYWGVDAIDGRIATLSGQVACTDSARAGVQREINRRIKRAFQARGIRLMPSGTVMALQHPLDVRVEAQEVPLRGLATRER